MSVEIVGRDLEDIPDEFLPHELVLSIDHILERIFSYLDTTDLFTCRVVSHRFLKFTQILLQKQACLKFEYYWQEGRNRKCTGRKFEQLIQFLKRPSLPSHLISFPCTNFEFKVAQLDDKVLQDFFKIDGQNIRKFSLHSFNENSPSEDVLMNQLYNLVTRQAPHLQNLSLTLNPAVKWQQKTPPEILSLHNINGVRMKDSALFESDPEYQQISAKIESLPSRSRLKILKVEGQGLAKIIEFLLQLSPQLEEVNLIEDHHIYFLQPVNRIHLLKSLELHPESRTDASTHVENFHRFYKGEAEISLPQNNLRLRELQISLRNAIPLCKTNPELENKVILKINKILEDSKDTLEILRLESITFLPGMKIPTPMSKVREIQIDDEPSTANSKIFPQGLSWSETFPRLTLVTLVYFEPGFFEYLNCNFGGGGDSAVVTFGVKKVILSTSWRLPGRTLKRIAAKFSQRIQKLFPNAVIEIQKFGYENLKYTYLSFV